MNFDKLIGLRLECCRLSKGSYAFELDGKKDGVFLNFSIDSSCCLSFSGERIDVCENFSKYMWDILETDLINVHENKNKGEIIFEFEGNKKIYIWNDGFPVNYLVMIKNTKTGDWYMAGETNQVQFGYEG